MELVDQLLDIARRISLGEIPPYQHNELYTAGAFDLLIVHARGDAAFKLIAEICARFPSERHKGGDLSGYYQLLTQLARQSDTTQMPLVGLLRLTTLHAADAEPLTPPKPFKAPSGAFYPDSARRLGQEGRVLAAFKISTAGRVVDLRIAAAEPKGVFNSKVADYMRGLEFAVPADWEATGGAHHEYTISFVFRLSVCPGSTPREEPVQFQADYQPIIFTGSVICPAPPAKHTTQTEADRVYCEYMREQGASPASCAKP